MEEIISLVIARKEELGVTWDQVSDKSGVSRSTICGWLYKGISPSLQLLLYVLEALGLEIKFIPSSKERSTK